MNLFLVDIIKSRSKIRNKTLENKKKNIIKDFKTINFLINEENKDLNKFKDFVDDNIEMMRFLNKKVYISN